MKKLLVLPLAEPSSSQGRAGRYPGDPLLTRLLKQWWMQQLQTAEPAKLGPEPSCSRSTENNSAYHKEVLGRQVS